LQADAKNLGKEMADAIVAAMPQNLGATTEGVAEDRFGILGKEESDCWRNAAISPTTRPLA